MSLSGAAIILASALAQAGGGPLGDIEIEHALSADAVIRAGSETGREAALLADLTLDLSAERIDTQGRRWGAAVSLRAQRDAERRGLAWQTGLCPPGQADCASTSGLPPAGLLSGLHAAGGDLDREGVDVEAAYLYVKTSFFEARAGRGPGAAVLEAEPLPGAFRLMRADAGLVDPEGLALASTANTLSTHAAKLLVRTTRLYGLRAAASYTPKADACGVDVCRLDSAPGGPVLAELDHVIEAALSFDHHFRGSGQRWSAVITASHGEAEGAFASAFEDPYALSARLVWSRGPVSLGAGALYSNDGWQDGAYQAYSASLSYESGSWLSALEWARGDSDLAHAKGWTVQLGTSRLFDNGVLAGFGVRHGEAKVPVIASGRRRGDVRAASSVFVETGLRF